MAVDVRTPLEGDVLVVTTADGTRIHTVSAGEGPVAFDSYVASNLAGWRAEAGGLDSVRWAEAAHRLMDAQREVEQEPNMALAHLARAFGCRGPSSNCMKVPLA